MEQAKRIELHLARTFRVSMDAPVSAVELSSALNQLSQGRIDPQVTEEIFGEMLEVQNPPPWRLFPAVFVEAIQRIEGKLQHLDQQIRQAEARPAAGPPELSVAPGQECLVFRAVQVAGLPPQELLLEFAQNGRRARVPFSLFRNSDAVLRGYARSSALRVELLEAATGAPLADFELWPAEVGQGSRAAVEKLLARLGPHASVFFHAQSVRSAEEYAESVRAFNAENARGMKEVRAEFQRIKHSVRDVFPPDVLNYEGLTPLRVDGEGSLDFQSNALQGHRVVELVGDSVGALPVPSYGQLPPEGSVVKPSFSRNKLLSNSEVNGGVKPPMNLSPFAASFVGGQSERAVQGAPQSTRLYGAGGGAAPVAWNPQLELVSRLVLGLGVLALVECLARPSFLPLLASLAFLFWHRFRNEHDFHLTPAHFLCAFAVCALADLAWIAAQAGHFWMRGGLQTHRLLRVVDRLVVVLAPLQLAFESALIYFFFLLRRQGVFPAAAGSPPGALPKQPFKIVF